MRSRGPKNLLKKMKQTPRMEAMTISVVKHLWFHLFILVSIFAISASADDPDCVYTFYIRTGSIIGAGTNSHITITFSDAAGHGIRIFNIETWGGLMGSGHDYFERGNLDIFSGRGPCLTGPVCAMNLTSDGTGRHHGWYCNYVELTTAGVHKTCARQLFTVEQWLATDRSPHTLTAIVDRCGNNHLGGNNHLVLDDDSESSVLVAEM